MRIRAAQTSDFPAIEKLLRETKLPVDGAREHLQHFLVLENGSQVIGTVGLEIYDRDALLRSLAVGEHEQGKGLGNKLYNAAIATARQRNIKNLYLLTETAEAFFAKKGFVRIDRASVSSAVTRSVEFRSACPASAACMVLRVDK